MWTGTKIEKKKKNAIQNSAYKSALFSVIFTLYLKVSLNGNTFSLIESFIVERSWGPFFGISHFKEGFYVFHVYRLSHEERNSTQMLPICMFGRDEIKNWLLFLNNIF